MSNDLATILHTKLDAAERRLYLFGAIDSSKAFEVIASLQYLTRSNPKKVKPVELVICSEGGEEGPGWAIVDAVLAAPFVTTIGVGEISSMAAAVFVAGAKRQMTPNCRLMIHNGVTCLGECDTDRLVNRVRDIELMNVKYAEFLASHSGLTLEKVLGMCRKETFLSAREAVRLGFADEVLE